MANKLHLTAVALFAMVPIFSAAQTVATVGELDSLQSEKIIMKARAALETERENYQKARASNGDTDGTLPVLKSIMGGEGRQIVTFIYPGNVKVAARLHESIPGGFTVGKVDDDAGQVELVRGKERYKVGFSTVAPVSRQKQAAQPQTGPYAVPPLTMPQ